jgi:hypothetical protein
LVETGIGLGCGPPPSSRVEEKFTRDRPDSIYCGELGIVIGTV